MSRVKNVISMYKHTNAARNATSNVKWRLLMVVVLIASILTIREHVTNKYAAEFPVPAGMHFLIADKVVYWLIVGVMLGIVFAWLMHEGEVLLSLWKFANRIEKKALVDIGQAVGMAQKKAPAKPAAKKKK